MYRTETTVSMGQLELTELTTNTMVYAEHMETMELMPKTTAKTEHIKATEPVTQLPVNMEQTEVMVLTDDTELTVNMTKMLFLKDLVEVMELLIELLVKMEWTETKVLGAIAYNGAAFADTIVAFEDATKFTHKKITLVWLPIILTVLKLLLEGSLPIAVFCGPTCHRRRSLRLGTGTLLSLYNCSSSVPCCCQCLMLKLDDSGLLLRVVPRAADFVSSPSSLPVRSP